MLRAASNHGRRCCPVDQTEKLWKTGDMKKTFCSLMSTLLVLAAFSNTVFAAGGKPAEFKTVKVAKRFPVPVAKSFVVPVAKLMRVDDGVFELEIGKTIDLTDRKILLAIVLTGGRRKECCKITVNGGRISWRSVGTRIDLKRERSTAAFVEDKDVCYLDIVDIALPKGAPGIATFRLHCV
jgi:hypothetical protein